MLALVLVVGATTIDNHLFLSATNLQQLLSGAAIIALLAIGETIVIVTRNVDLSIGSVLGISAYATGVLYVHHPHVSLAVVFLVALGIGVACGVVNGAIVTRRARAEPRRHARDALHHPRHRRRLGGRQPGQRVDAARTASTRSATARSLGVPYLGDHRDRRRRDRHLRDAQLPHRPRLLRDRLQSGRRAPRGHPRRLARVSRLRPERRDRRARRRALARRSTARSTRSPAPATSSR